MAMPKAVRALPVSEQQHHAHPVWPGHVARPCASVVPGLSVGNASALGAGYLEEQLL